ncbi:MAG: peptidylprolyl isomerase [Ignavibacteriales bacterium]|nr:peptidylprolyl isomerase [Ignavibacteriales bacterium]
MKALFFSFVLLAQFALSQFGYQTNQLPLDTLASISTQVITAKDFLERFELMPWPQKDVKSRIEYTKLEFLYSLVAEKLMAMEASAQQIGFDSATQSMQYNLERLFVRDEFYKREVLPKIEISNAEIQKGLSRYAYEIEVEILGVLSKAEGDLFFKKYKQAKNKRTILKLFYDSLYIPVDTVQLSFGSADLALEEAAFTIDKDSLSKPVESSIYGTVMLRLLKKYTNPEYAKFNRQDQAHKVRNIIKGRKEDSLATKAFVSVTASQRAEAKPDLFFMLADTIHALMSLDSNAYRTKNVYMLSGGLLDDIQKRLVAYLQNEFVTFASGAPMTFGEVLLGLSNNYVVFPNLQKEYVQWVLNNNMKTVIQNELLTREGLRKNLQQSENVRHDLSTWMDNRRSALLLRKVIDTVKVSETEIEEEYQKDPAFFGATMLVRLREILVDSISLAKGLKEKLKRGEDFATLARKYSKRKEWTKDGGESVLTDIKNLGELGMFAATAKIGEVEGPWKIKEGLTIFTVLERKVIDDSLRMNFAETKRTIEQKLLGVKRQKTLDQYIGTLAKKYGVTLNEANLRKTSTSTSSMFTWRHIGFGGRIVAVPQVLRQTEWVYEWLRRENLNQ